MPPKWWHYGQEGGFESHASFTDRAKGLREYLGSLIDSDLIQGKKSTMDRPIIIALVSHGGILSKAFGENGVEKKFKNCEFRVYDIAEDGTFRRPHQESDQVQSAKARKE